MSLHCLEYNLEKNMFYGSSSSCLYQDLLHSSYSVVGINPKKTLRKKAAGLVPPMVGCMSAFVHSVDEYFSTGRDD